jgi:hypothetical protein
MVLLVLKLLVSSHPLKLEGVLCIYVLLLHEGQAENHLLCFPYDLNTCFTFIVSLFMIFRLCSFLCYNMVAKFLLLRLCLFFETFMTVGKTPTASLLPKSKGGLQKNVHRGRGKGNKQTSGLQSIIYQ